MASQGEQVPNTFSASAEESSTNKLLTNAMEMQNSLKTASSTVPVTEAMMVSGLVLNTVRRHCKDIYYKYSCGL